MKGIKNKSNYEFVKIDICYFDGVLKLMQNEKVTRSNSQKGVEWRFTNEEARVKPKHLYPLVNF